MSIDAESIAAFSCERVDPQNMAGRLVESEHRGRYWWAAQLAPGRQVLDAGCGTGYGTEILAAAGAESVVGIDISQEALDYARSSFEAASRGFMLGDLRELPVEDQTFDLAVCFEVIEHVEEQQRVIGELHRVLRPGGVLAISSPNRGVYPAGNPYHVHEYQSEEFRQALASEFAHVRLYRQSAWLSAAVLDDNQSRAIGSNDQLMLRTIKTGSIKPGAETYTVALASDAELPSPESLVVLGDPFELGWWDDRVTRIADERDQERVQREHERAQHEHEHLEQGRALLAVEAYLANARNEIAELLSAEADLKRWVEQIRHSAERVAKRAEEKHARERQRGGDFENRLRRAERTIDDITNSLSWRLTRPLRAVKRLL